MSDQNHENVEADRLQDMLTAAATACGEHFESVIILATNGHADHTKYFRAISGNGAASRGAVESYLDIERGFDRAAGAAKFHRHADTD